MFRLFAKVFGFITKITTVIFELSFPEAGIFRFPGGMWGWVFSMPRRGWGRPGNSLMGSLAWVYTAATFKSALGKDRRPRSQHWVV